MGESDVMKMNKDEFDPENEEFIAKLARLAPAAPRLDPHIVFYQAGLAAGEARQRLRLRRIGSCAVAASLISVCVAATLAYRAGSAAAAHDMAGYIKQSAISRNAQHVVQHDTPSHSQQLANELREQPINGPALVAAKPDLPEPAPAVSWWSLWLPSEMERAPRNYDLLLETGRPIALVGLSSFSQGGSLAQPTSLLDQGAESDTIAPGIRPPDPLHPGDWKSLLPTF